MNPKKEADALPEPLIPENYVDIPSQRLYYLSLGCLLQVCFSLDLVYPKLTVQRE